MSAPTRRVSLGDARRESDTRDETTSHLHANGRVSVGDSDRRDETAPMAHAIPPPERTTLRRGGTASRAAAPQVLRFSAIERAQPSNVEGLAAAARERGAPLRARKEELRTMAKEERKQYVSALLQYMREVAIVDAREQLAVTAGLGPLLLLNVENSTRWALLVYNVAGATAILTEDAVRVNGDTLLHLCRFFLHLGVDGNVLHQVATQTAVLTEQKGEWALSTPAYVEWLEKRHETGNEGMAEPTDGVVVNMVLQEFDTGAAKMHMMLVAAFASNRGRATSGGALAYKLYGILAAVSMLNEDVTFARERGTTEQELSWILEENADFTSGEGPPWPYKREYTKEQALAAEAEMSIPAHLSEDAARRAMEIARQHDDVLLALEALDVQTLEELNASHAAQVGSILYEAIALELRKLLVAVVSVLPIGFFHLSGVVAMTYVRAANPQLAPRDRADVLAEVVAAFYSANMDVGFLRLVRECTLRPAASGTPQFTEDIERLHAHMTAHLGFNESSAKHLDKAREYLGKGLGPSQLSVLIDCASTLLRGMPSKPAGGEVSALSTPSPLSPVEESYLRKPAHHAPPDEVLLGALKLARTRGQGLEAGHRQPGERHPVSDNRPPGRRTGGGGVSRRKSGTDREHGAHDAAHETHRVPTPRSVVAQAARTASVRSLRRGTQRGSVEEAQEDEDDDETARRSTRANETRTARSRASDTRSSARHSAVEASATTV
jgi:hypothetical protein